MRDPATYTRLDDHGASEQWENDHPGWDGDEEPEEQIFIDRGGPLKPGLNKGYDCSGLPVYMFLHVPDKTDPQEDQ